jgi:Protein of unknown function (DUF3592)
LNESSASNVKKSAVPGSATRRLLRLAMAILALFAGACTLFAGVVTAVQAWQEHAQAQWPLVSGSVETCDIVYASAGHRRRQYIRCRFSYRTATEQNTTTITSSYFPAPEVAQYPADQRQPYVDWVNAHAPGTLVTLRYDPENHARAILAEDFMPRGGPHTPNNVRLLAVFAGLSVVALVLLRVLKPGDATQTS